jgi:RNA polymerase sigma-70 factor (ECF subfamily)
MPDDQEDQLEDSALVELAQSGDKIAFGVLYDRYANGIYRFIRVQHPDSVEAEDVTSEVFLKAWRFLPRYKERGHPFSAYLFKIARNTLIDHHRKSKGWAARVTRDLDALPDETAGRGDIGVRVEEHQRLFGALQKLRVDYRTVLVLRFINGLAPGEVARIMGRSEGAVRVLQHRALKAIRKIW